MSYERQLYFRDICEAFGLPFIEVDDPVTGLPWQLHAARSETERDYVPQGLINHHTASVRNYPEEPWYPVDKLRTKCNVNIKPDGVVYLISSGYQYDSGYGDRNVLQAVVDDVAAPRPTDTYVDGKPGGTNPGVLMNPWFIDIECDHPGDGRDIAAEQYESLVLFNAGVLLAKGWGVKQLKGHKELTRRKIDPYWNQDRNIMNLIRFDTEKAMRMYMSTFKDVPEDHLFFDEIEWLAGEGITKGCNPPENDLFCPDAAVTRGQFAAMLFRYDQSKGGV